MSGTFNSIRIDLSNVGVVNTGSIQPVQVSLAGIEQGGQRRGGRSAEGNDRGCDQQP
jgi:hypothetical protein